MRTKLSNLKAAAEVQRLALKIQNKGIAEVFVSFAGHVKSLQVTVWLPRWTAHGKATATYNAYLDDRDANELQTIILNLNKLIDANKQLN